MSSPAPRIRIWCQPDGWWRWCYVEPGRDGAAEFTLPSNERYDTAEQARASAEVAYPGAEAEQAGLPEVGQAEVGQAGGRQAAAPRWSYRHALWLVLTVVLIHLVRRWRKGARPA